MDYLGPFSAKLASKITGAVGTMQCAGVFAVIALISLPAAISSGSVIVIVAWVAQTFLQLVLLSIIMVGQNVQSKASDVRAAKTFEDVEVLLDRLDEHTEGGIKAILDHVDQRNDVLAATLAPRAPAVVRALPVKRVKPKPAKPKPSK